jgi:hypothetical protein
MKTVFTLHFIARLLAYYQQNEYGRGEYIFIKESENAELARIKVKTIVEKYHSFILHADGDSAPNNKSLFGILSISVDSYLYDLSVVLALLRFDNVCCEILGVSLVNRSEKLY